MDKVEPFNLEWKERVLWRSVEDMKAPARAGRGGGLAKVTSLALGLAMFGTVGLSGTLAQEEDVSVGTADAEAIVNGIIAQVFGEIFGGGVVEDDAADTGAGDLHQGGSTGSTVTMGGGGGYLDRRRTPVAAAWVAAAVAVSRSVTITGADPKSR